MTQDVQESAALILLRRFIEAVLAVLGPRKGARVLKVFADGIAEEERLSEVSPIRKGEEPSAAARKVATEWFRRSFSGFAAKLG